MAFSVRFYLWAEDGPKRITARQSEQLERGEIALPQYAGTTQKYVEAIIEKDRRHAVLCRATGYYRSFDERGFFTGRDEQYRAAVAMASAVMTAALTRTMPCLPDQFGLGGPQGINVVDIAPQLEKARWTRENTWTLSEPDLKLIASDLMGTKRPRGAQAIPIVKSGCRERQ